MTELLNYIFLISEFKTVSFQFKLLIVKFCYFYTDQPKLRVGPGQVTDCEGFIITAEVYFQVFGLRCQVEWWLSKVVVVGTGRGRQYLGAEKA